MSIETPINRDACQWISRVNAEYIQEETWEFAHREAFVQHADTLRGGREPSEAPCEVQHTIPVKDRENIQHSSLSYLYWSVDGLGGVTVIACESWQSFSNAVRREGDNRGEAIAQQGHMQESRYPWRDGGVLRNQGTCTCPDRAPGSGGPSRRFPRQLPDGITRSVD